jgi:hypothetical protein
MLGESPLLADHIHKAQAKASVEKKLGQQHHQASFTNSILHFLFGKVPRFQMRGTP